MTSIEFTGSLARFGESVGIDETESLLGWLQDREDAQLSLALCRHLHPAVLQVLMAARVPVQDWPEDAALRAWLEPVLCHPTR
ncbi:hypothetical protein [Roseateles amylovorans]|uniref:Uncharacterized protein n=1 Tax=Roseateles amylovorans TaxID=2978473 RepID=A0ABY6AVR1_9BURK|nr:hypothetical protein [Roseateles amylovorans]UXH76772.1 hypothetical protein N4261_17245 [Roseateles amylovorans]